MSSRRNSKTEEPEASHAGPSSIEADSDEQNVEDKQPSCSPWKCGRQKQKVKDKPYSSFPWKRGRQKQTKIEELMETLASKETKIEELMDTLGSKEEEEVRLQQQVEELQKTLETEKSDWKEENNRREECWQKERQQSEEEKVKLEQRVRQLQTEKSDLEKEHKRKEERWQEERQQSRELQTALMTEKSNWEEDNKKREEEKKRREEDWQKERQQSRKEKISLQQQVQELQAALLKEKSDREEENKRREEEKRRREELWQTERQQNRAQIADYKQRLSEMASERMRQGNACVEDLNDPFRPTALADKWTGLFKTGEYWTAYDKAHNTLRSEEATADFLYNVAKTVWKVCSDFVEDFVPRVLVAAPCSPDMVWTEREKELRQQMSDKLPEVRGKLKVLLPEDASRVDNILETLEKEYNNVLQTDIPNLQQKLRKAVTLLPKSATPPALLAEKVVKAIQEEEGNKNAKVDENFVRKLAGLCYLMRLQEVPLSAAFDCTRGSPLDQSMFEVESSASQPQADMAIKSILRPPLLRSAGGAVLSKGEADVEPAKPASEATEPDAASEKQNDEETPESNAGNGYKNDEQNSKSGGDENNQDEENTPEAEGSPGDVLSQDGSSDQGEAQERFVDAVQTHTEEHEDDNNQDRHEEGSGRGESKADSKTSQDEASGAHDDK